jgi:hypothetical protein
MGKRYEKNIVFQITRKAFVQRANRDGSFRSVCSRCGKIVSVGADRVTLADDESKHICPNPNESD